MDPRISIRLFTPADSITELTDLLHRAYASLGGKGLNYSAVNQTPEETERVMKRGECVIAVQCDVVVGTITIIGPHASAECSWYRRSDVASARRLAVEPALQRSGVGLSLLKWAEDHARGKGFAELALDTAEPAEHLVQFYMSHGYRFIEHIQWPGKHYRSVVLSRALARAP